MNEAFRNWAEWSIAYLLLTTFTSCDKSDAFDAALGIYDVTYYNYLEADTIETSIEIKKAGFNCIQFEGTQVDNIKFQIDDLGMFENGDCGANRPHTIGVAHSDSLSLRSYAGPACVISKFWYTGKKRQ